MRACRWATPAMCAGAPPPAISKCAGTLTRDGRVDVEGVSGDITLRLSAPGGLSTEIESFSGDINGCLADNVERVSKYGPGKRLNIRTVEAGARVRAKTLSGDIEICDSSLTGRETLAADLATMSAACVLIKWVSLGLGALVALVVLGVLVVVWLVDPNSFKSQIEAAVRDRTGREFTLVGDIELGFFPWLSLRTGEGRFGSPAGFGPEPLVSWKSAQLGVKLIPLLRGDVIADRIFLSGADLRLVRHADGSANWLGLGGAEPADPGAKPTQLNVDGLEIENSRLLFIDEACSPAHRNHRLQSNYRRDLAGRAVHRHRNRRRVAHGRIRRRRRAVQARGARSDSCRQTSRRSRWRSSPSRLVASRPRARSAARSAKSRSSAGELETNTFRPARAAHVGRHRAAENHRPEGARQDAASAAPGLSTMARSASIRFDFDLDDTHFTGSFSRTAGDDALGEFLLAGTLHRHRALHSADRSGERALRPAHGRIEGVALSRRNPASNTRRSTTST